VTDRVNSTTGNENTCEIVAFIYIVRFADVQAEHISAHFILGDDIYLQCLHLFLNQI
jgi:hypothetical protein